MYKRRRYICGILACIIGLTGCRTDEKKKDLEQNEREYARVSLFCDVEFWKPPVWDTAEDTITGEISQKTGLALDIYVPVQDADTQLSLMLVNDNLPDLISVTDSTVTSQLVSSGKVWNLEEFLKQYKPDSHLLHEFPEDIKKELIKRDGGWYALPSHLNSEDAREMWKPREKCYEDLVKYEDNNAIIWNKALLEEAGLSVEELTTEQQVMAALEKVKNMHLQVEGQEVIPLLVDGTDYQNHTLKFLQWSFGAEYVDAQGNYRDIFRQPETRDALSFLNRAVRNLYITPEQFTMENDQIKSLIASQRVLCFIGNIANTSFNPMQWVSSGPVFSESGKTPVLGKNCRASTGWIGTFVSKSCSHPEETAAFIDYMTSEEGMLFWEYGFEGIHYIRDEEGHVIRTEEGEQDRNAYSQSGLGAWWMFANTAWSRSVLPPIEKGSVDEADQRIRTAYGSNRRTVIFDLSLLNAPVDSREEDSEQESGEPQINAWKKSQVLKMILADTDEAFEEEFQTFCSTLKELGIETLEKKKDENYKKNCQEYGEVIRKVNG